LNRRAQTPLQLNLFDMVVDGSPRCLQFLSDKRSCIFKIKNPLSMVGWGNKGAKYVRFVFSNEPQERLIGMGTKVKRALGA